MEKMLKTINRVDQIKELSEELNFEEAIKVRDKMNELKKVLMEL